MTLPARIILVCLVLCGLPPTLFASVDVAPLVQIAAVVDTTFYHRAHEAVACATCHSMRPQHGVSLLRNVSDCRSCHHASDPVVAECTACHQASALQQEVYTLRRSFDLSVSDEVSDRDVPFLHAAHEAHACSDCHAEGPSLRVPELDCQSCHEEHHDVTATGCLSCHEEAPAEAHPLEVHRTCTGSACHTSNPVQAPLRTRAACLWCHAEQAEHLPDRNCVACHLMPGPSAMSNER